MVRANVCSTGSVFLRTRTAAVDSAGVTRTSAGHRAGPRMERADQHWQYLPMACVEWQDLPSLSKVAFARSPAPAGAGQNSSACETSHRKDPHHEGWIGEARCCAIYTARLDGPGSSRTFNSPTPSTKRRKPISGSQAMLDGTLLRGKYDDGGFFRAATPIGLPCSDCWRERTARRST